MKIKTTDLKTIAKALKIVMGQDEFDDLSLDLEETAWFHLEDLQEEDPTIMETDAVNIILRLSEEMDNLE